MNDSEPESKPEIKPISRIYKALIYTLISIISIILIFALALRFPENEKYQVIEEIIAAIIVLMFTLYMTFRYL